MDTSEVKLFNINSNNPIESFYESSQVTPNRTALLSSKVNLNFLQLKRISQQAAQKLKTLGIQHGDVVGLRCQPEITVVLSLALLQIGATSLAINAKVMENYRELIDFLLIDEFIPSLSHSNLINVDQDFVSSLDSISPLEEIQAINNRDIVRIVFSSGSTGVPKGVPFSKEIFVARIESALKNWIPSQPFMSLLGPETVTGFQTMFAQLFTGNTYYLAYDQDEAWNIVVGHSIESIKASPAKLKELLDKAETSQTRSATLPLQTIQVAGSLLSIPIAEKCHEILGVWPTYLYGSTEIGTVTKGLFDKSQPNCVGEIISEVSCEILDSNNEVLPQGQIGTIRIRREPMAQSYWGKSTSSSSGFVDKWFVPGDMGFINNKNELVLDGRIDDLINLGGVKINIAELDLRLSQISQFKDVAAVIYNNPLGEKELGIAFVSEMNLSIEDVQRQCKRVANGISVNSFIKLDLIPRSSLGKVERKNLTKLVEEKIYA